MAVEISTLEMAGHFGLPISALSQKQTFRIARFMSALPPEKDVWIFKRA